MLLNESRKVTITMIELYSLMWVVAVFTGMLGYLRGWNREIIVTAGCVLAMFVLFQFDSLIRGTLLLSFPSDQVFFIQTALFLIIVYLAYRGQAFNPREKKDLGAGFLGALIGFLNGYLVMGTIWYFLDINEYPLDPLIVAPSLNSPSAQSIATMPMVILSGGVGGSGDFLAVIVIALLLIVIFAIS